MHREEGGGMEKGVNRGEKSTAKDPQRREGRGEGARALLGGVVVGPSARGGASAPVPAPHAAPRTALTSERGKGAGSLR